MGEIRTVEFTAAYSSAVGHFIFTLEETEYNESTNRSKISLRSLTFYNTSYSDYQAEARGIVKLNGSTVSTLNGTYFRIRKEPGYTLTFADNSTEVQRSEDGSLTVELGVWPVGDWGGFIIRATDGHSAYFRIDSDNVKTAAFTPIPRASDVSFLTPNADTLGGISLIVEPKKAGVKHKVSFSSGGIGLYTSDFFDTSISLTVPRSWFNSFPSTDVLTVTASVQTYNADGTTLGDPVAGTVTVTADALMKPTVSTGWAAVSPYNAGAASGFTGYIQGFSAAQAAFNTAKITHAAGATLASLSITCMGVSVSAAPYRTGVLTCSATAVCTVTDSRGRTASESFDLTVMPYAKPTISAISIFRSDSSGTQDEDGAFFSVRAAINISSLSGQNSGVLKTAFKIKGGSYGAETTLTSGTASVIGTASPDSIYVVRITATDALGETALYEQTIPARAWAMKFRSGGMGVGFGKAPTQDNVLELPAGWSVRIGDTTINEAQLAALLALI